MAFSILSKRLLEDENIHKIVNSVLTKPVFSMNILANWFWVKTNGLGTFPFIILQDYDSFDKKGIVYVDRLTSYRIEWSEGKCEVLPIINFAEIRDNSQVISEDEDTLTIQYGRGLTNGRFVSKDTLELVNQASKMGKLEESGRKITIFLAEDGTKTQLRVFQDEVNWREYVFMTRKSDGSFDDSFNPEATFVGEVAPLTWIVDKKSGIAICENRLFLVDAFHCSYSQSALASFLASDEFMKELGVQPQKKQEKKKAFTNPFGDKKEKLTLEQKIRRILIGGTRIPYLVGHPGIGKTQIAKSINPNCLSFNMSTFTPDAFTGKTSIIPGDKIITQDGNRTVEHNEKGRTATAEPELYTKLLEMSNRCRESHERCVLLLDEFDKLTPNMQVFINGIVDNPRTIAGWEIPDNVDIILAGNTEEYSDAAFSISGEVASRLTRVDVSAEAIDWLKWASKHNIDPIVRAYLHSFPNKIIQDVKDADGAYDYALSLTPRSWDQKISEELKGSRITHSFPYLQPYMDEKNREEFEEFISMYFELGVEEILKGNISDAFLGDFAHVQMIINCLIATATTEEEIVNAMKFIKRNNLSEYESLFEHNWQRINDTDEDILRFRLAKNSLSEVELIHANEK